MDTPVRGDMTQMMETLNSIPIYPETIKLHATRKLALAAELGLCEDEKGRISWISDEAKRNAIDKRIGRMIPKPEPKCEKNKAYNAFGKSQKLKEWACEYGICYQTLSTRMHVQGMSLEEALTKPKQTNKEKVRPRV